MKNAQIAEIFENIAAILQIRDMPNDRFRIRAYENAAAVLKELPMDIENIALRGELLTLPGIGKDLSQKIKDYVETGQIEMYERLKKDYPESLLNLLKVQSLGPKKLKVLHETFGVQDLDGLEKVLKSGQANSLPKFGQKSIENMLAGIERVRTIQDRVLIGFIYPKVKDLVERLKQVKGIKKVEAAGSFRRHQETIGDIDILACGDDHEAIFEAFAKFPEIESVLVKGDTKTSVIIEGGRQVDLRVIDIGSFGAAMQYFTGNVKHNVKIRTLALKQGMTINEYALTKIDTGEIVACQSEQEVYNALGLQYIPPELRSDSGEIEASAKNKLPKLIELSDIKGDLHCHSTYSDGRNSIEQMALAAQKMGYEYIALTDHSPKLSIAHGVSLDNLKKKKAEINELNKKLDIKILFGTEVDILDDGGLDYPDEVLKEFDIVIASIHNKFNQDNTERIIKAMQNPHVHAIGHISGRLIGTRDPYPLDYEKIFEEAVKTKTWIEINAQPQRLDLADIYIRSAKEKGVKFIINTDSHFDGSLWLMELGVGYGRRGWLEAEDVVNTMSWEKFKKTLNID